MHAIFPRTKGSPGATLTLRLLVLLVLLAILCLELAQARGITGLDPCDQEVAARTALEVHEELVRLAGGSWPDVTAYTRARTAGFIFTNSYRSISADADNTDGNGVPPQYALSPSTDGYYTRTAFRLYYGQVSDVNNPTGAFVTEQTVVAVAAPQQSPPLCSFTGGACDALTTGQLCESVAPTTVKLSLTAPLMTEFTLLQSDAASNDPIQAPFGFVSIDDTTSGISPPECVAEGLGYEGTACAQPGSNCNGMVPCSGSFINGAQIDSLMLASCGTQTDQWTGWDARLNPQCFTACCGTDNSSHQRWGVGPPARMYALSSPVLRTSGLDVTVTDSVGVQHSLHIEDLKPGTYTVDSTPGALRTIRVQIVRTYALPIAAENQLQNGRVVAWGEPGNVPAGRPNVVPTATFFNASGGWAYIDPANAYGYTTATNGYLQGQNGVTSPGRGFGLPENCDYGTSDYYATFQNVPGLYSPNGPPYVRSFCQISNDLNVLGQDFVANPQNYLNYTGCPASITSRVSADLPNGYNLFIPNYALDETNGVFTRFLDGAGCGLSEVAATEVYVDISTDVMPYRSASSTAGFSLSTSACAYSFVGQLVVGNGTTPSPSPSPSFPLPYPGQGVLMLTVQNPLHAQTQFAIVASCSVVGGAGSWNVGPISPNNFPLTVLGGSETTAQPIRFVITPSVVGQSSPSDPLIINCTAEVQQSLTDHTVLARHTFQCYNVSQQIVHHLNTTQILPTPLPNCTSIFDTDCEGHDTGYWLEVGFVCLIIALIIVGVAACALTIYCRKRRSSAATGGDSGGPGDDYDYIGTSSGTKDD